MPAPAPWASARQASGWLGPCRSPETLWPSSSSILRDSGALLLRMLVKTLKREAAVAPGRAGRQGHRDEDRLADLRVGRARLARALRMGVDAPRALTDLGDPDRDQFLGLHRERPVRERLGV